MKTALTLVFFLFVVCVAPAQTVVKIVAKDRSNRDPISRVFIRQIENGIQVATAYSDMKGVAYLTVSTETPTTFEVEHVAYFPIDKVPTRKYSGTLSDTTTVSLRMYFDKERRLDEVVIKPVGKPDTIFQSTRISIADFEFLPSGNLLLLAYSKNLKKGTELLLYDGFTVLSEIPLPEKGEELIRDFRGNVHVVTEKNVYGIFESNRKVEIAQIEKGYYMTYIAPIVDTTHTKYYFSNYNPLYPAFDYFTYDIVDSTYRKIAHVEDELMMELYRSEFKWVDVRTKLWAREKENETGIDRQIWVGMYYFTSSIYYKEVYAPLFQRNDSVFLFDHYKNMLFTYSFEGDVLDSVPIFYHLQPKETGWKRQLIQDTETGEIYCYFELAGKAFLRHFNTTTGNVGPAMELHFRYPTHIQVRSNSVYYIYRPFESIQKKFLYRERLPVQFKKQKMNQGTEVKLVKS